MTDWADSIKSFLRFFVLSQVNQILQPSKQPIRCLSFEPSRRSFISSRHPTSHALLSVCSLRSPSPFMPRMTNEMCDWAAAAAEMGNPHSVSALLLIRYFYLSLDICIRSYL